MRVIAHRGASALAPENTLAALRAAVEAGADAIEIDVRLTADGHPVLMHDDKTRRTTGEAGLISRMSLEEVRELNAAAFFDGWQDVERVPTLAEALDVVAGAAGFVFELKGAPRADGYQPASPVAEAIADAIRALPDVVVSSFDPHSLTTMQELIPGIATGVTGYRLRGREWLIDAMVDGKHAECHVAHEQLDAEFVRQVHEAGGKVLGWIVNDADRVRALRDMGVDGVFTDDPALARAAIEGAG